MSRTGWGGIIGVLATVAISGLWGCSTNESSQSGPNAKSDGVAVATPKADAPKAVEPVKTVDSSKAIESPKTPASESTKTEPVAEAAKPETPAVPATPVADARPKNITYDDLKFDMPNKDMPFERSMLTPQIESLDARRVRVRGYILPSYTDTLSRFILMRDNKECCFGPGAWVYDCVLVEMKPDKTAQFSTLPVTVEGTFSIQPWKDGEGVVRAVYHIDGESVQ